MLLYRYPVFIFSLPLWKDFNLRPTDPKPKALDLTPPKPWAKAWAAQDPWPKAWAAEAEAPPTTTATEAEDQAAEAPPMLAAESQA